MALLSQFSENEPQEQKSTVQQNENVKVSQPSLITKDTFKGNWAFNADKVYISCVELKDMHGYKVNIDGKEYSLANVKELPYLPDNLWKDIPMENGLCLKGAYSNGCKVYLDDTFEYAETLCGK